MDSGSKLTNNGQNRAMSTGKVLNKHRESGNLAGIPAIQESRTTNRLDKYTIERWAALE